MRFENISLPCFFTLSLAVHLALVPLLWRNSISGTPAFEPISVSFLPSVPPPKITGKEKSINPAPAQPRRQREPGRTKALKRTRAVEKKTEKREHRPEIRDLPLPPQLAARTEPGRVPQEPPATSPARPRTDDASIQRTPPREEASIFRKDNASAPLGRQQLLPGIRDLAKYNRPIPLNTQDPVLAPFTKTIESWIEAKWEYPDLAKHYGLQGKVTLEFTVLQNGHIDLLSVVRSSGSNLLDEEAVRAVKAAAPFPPIPPSIAANRLRIVAGFTYLNNSVALTNNP